jgi:hypothetical protein
MIIKASETDLAAHRRQETSEAEKHLLFAFITWKNGKTPVLVPLLVVGRPEICEAKTLSVVHNIQHVQRFFLLPWPACVLLLALFCVFWETEF